MNWLWYALQLWIFQEHTCIGPDKSTNINKEIANTLIHNEESIKYIIIKSLINAFASLREVEKVVWLNCTEFDKIFDIKDDVSVIQNLVACYIRNKGMYLCLYIEYLIMPDLLYIYFSEPLLFDLSDVLTLRD